MGRYPAIAIALVVVFFIIVIMTANPAIKQTAMDLIKAFSGG